jgi:outer membrane protein OmpA-like peptidoglycan-associated protein
MRKVLIGSCLLVLVASGAFATGTTTYGLSGAIMTYYAYTLGAMHIAPQVGVDFWDAPYVTPPLAPNDPHHAHLYYITPGGFTLTFIKRLEFAAMVSSSGIEVRNYYDTNPASLIHEKILSEGGMGDTHIAVKGQITTEEQTKIGIASIVFVDLPTGKKDWSYEQPTADDPLYRKELKFLTQGKGNYNVGVLGAFSKQLIPKSEGDYSYNMLSLHGNIGYVVRTGNMYYADNIALYAFDQSDPADYATRLPGHVKESKRSDYAVLSGAIEFTPWRYFTGIFDTQFRMYQKVDSDAVLHPDGKAAKQTEVLAGLRINALSFFHVTMAFGKTFGKWSIDYTRGELSNKNYYANIILSADIPFRAPKPVIAPPPVPVVVTPPPEVVPPIEIKKPEKKQIVMNDLKFKPDSPELIEGQYSSLNEAGQTMVDYPDITVTISGHAASTGRPDFEMQLSYDRANTIKNYIVTKFGVDPSRITTKGFGSTMPVGDNSTPEGRAMNRRIEFTVNE